MMMGSAAFYNCPNASFKGKIGFSIDDDSGLIIKNHLLRVVNGLVSQTILISIDIYFIHK